MEAVVFIEGKRNLGVHGQRFWLQARAPQNLEDDREEEPDVLGQFGVIPLEDGLYALHEERGPGLVWRERIGETFPWFSQSIAELLGERVSSALLAAWCKPSARHQPSSNQKHGGPSEKDSEQRRGNE